MRQIISSVYGALLIAIWIGVMGTVIAVLDSGEPKWLLVVAGFVAATITVTLVQEFIEWRSRPRKNALEQKKHLVLSLLPHISQRSNPFAIGPV
jgi:uncharacterized membrane protein YjjP (DUF1212 family)